MAIIRFGPREGEVGILPGEGPRRPPFAIPKRRKEVVGIPEEERQAPRQRTGRRRIPEEEYEPPPPPRKSERELIKEEAWEAFREEFDSTYGTKFAREQNERYGLGRPGSYTIDVNRKAIIDVTRRHAPIMFNVWIKRWLRERI